MDLFCPTAGPLFLAENGRVPVLHRLKLFCKADRRRDGVLVGRISGYPPVSEFSIKSFSFRLLTPGLQDNAAGAGTGGNPLEFSHEYGRSAHTSGCRVCNDPLDLPFPIQPTESAVPYGLTYGIKYQDVGDEILRWYGERFLRCFGKMRYFFGSVSGEKLVC